jgi:mRNA-degrading endonuclease YafQ of YafQ-DinJ toxin-antitoxin module
MIRIRTEGQYDQMYQSLTENDLELRELVLYKVNLFRKNPKDTRLDNHPLHKRMEDKWAFSITDDIRIVYEWLGKSTARFLAIGGHPAVYAKQ